MVLVGPGELLLRDAERTLQRMVDEATDDVDLAFIACILGNADRRIALAHAADRVAEHRGAARSYRDAAVLGFAAEASGTASDDLTSVAAWLAGTSPLVAGVPTGIVADRVALLGAALGARRLGASSPLKDWLLKLMVSSDRDDATDAALLQAAAYVLGADVRTGSAAADAQFALAQVGLLPIEGLSGEPVVRLLLQGDLATEPRRAALQLAALDGVRTLLASISLAQPSIGEVARLLRRASAALHQWTWEERAHVRGGTPRKWHVDNEYHVQNLLWAILAPVFADLRREEYMEQVGPRQPRTDLGIPSLRLIVEAKFWRERDSASDFIEQIAADASLYFAGEPRRYDHLLVFTWDDARRTEAHAELERGLRRLPRVVDAVTISRPGKMVGDSP